MNHSLSARRLLLGCGLLVAALLTTTWGAVGERQAQAPFPGDPATLAAKAECNEREIVWEYEWPTTEKAASVQQPDSRFFFIAPAGRRLTGELLEARIALEGQDAPARTLSLEEFKAEHPGHWSNLKQLFVRITEVGVMRHFRIVELKVRPAIFTTSELSGHLLWARARLSFDQPAAPPALLGGRPLFDPTLAAHRDFQEVLEQLVSNPQGLSLYGAADPPRPVIAGAASLLTPPLQPLPERPLAEGRQPILRMEIERDGPYKLDMDALLAAGLDPASIKPQTIRIFHNGLEVPSYRLGASRGGFTEEDSLIFYATASDSPFTRANVYFAVIDEQNEPERIPLIDEPAPAGAPRPNWAVADCLVEEDNQLVMYTDNFLSIIDYCWIWEPLEPNQPTSHTFACQFLVPDAWQEQVQAQLSFFIRENTVSPAAPIEIDLNGVKATFQLTANKSREFSFALPLSKLRPQGNVLTITLHGSPGMPYSSPIFFDKLIFRYPRSLVCNEQSLSFSNEGHPLQGGKIYGVASRFRSLPLVLDVTSTAKPRLLQARYQAQGVVFSANETGPTSYHVTSLDDIMQPAKSSAPVLVEVLEREQPVEYLIISHRDFLAPARRLADFHAGRGVNTEVLDVEAIYNAFDYGLPTPLSIKAFLSHALRHWPAGGPVYVVLLGDCTSDYRGDFKNGPPSFVPCYTLDRGAELERWGSDHWFSTVAGDDEYSDLILARISVAEKTDAFTVVNKTIQQLTDPAPGPWRQQLIVVADDGFADDCEQLRKAFMPSTYSVNRVYLEEEPLKINFYLPQNYVEAERLKVSPATTTKIKDAINQGSIFISYHGHGSPNIWGDERIWFGGGSANSDNLLLTNRGVLPFMVNLTCNTGAIDYPYSLWIVCIAEDFMRVKNGGIIGGYVPSGPGKPQTHKQLCSVLYPILFTEKRNPVGLALLLTQYRYLALGYPQEMIQMFMHLGDPLLSQPWPEEVTQVVAEPSAVAAGTTQTVRLNHNFPELREGRARVQLFDEKGRLVERLPDISLEQGKLQIEATIPANARYGEWSLRASAWSLDREQPVNERMIWAPIQVDAPYLSIADFQVRGRETFAQVGEELNYVIELKNESAVDVTDGLLTLVCDSAPGEQRSLEFTCAAQSSTTLRGTWLAATKSDNGQTPSLQVFRARLERYTLPADPTRQPVVQASAGVVVGPPVSEPRALVAATSGSLNLVQTPDLMKVKVQLLIAAGGDKRLPAFKLSLKAPNGQALSVDLPALEPGEVRLVPFGGSLRTKSLPVELTLECSQPELLDRRIEQPFIILERRLLPDLQIDVANIRQTPKSPMDGETVIFTVPVFNAGPSTVDRAELEVYEQDPETGRLSILPAQFKALPTLIIEGLRPGVRREVEVRWDPTNPMHNAGQRFISFRLDDDDLLVEQDETNNIITYELYVRTNYDLKVGAPAVEGTGEPNVIKITTNVINEGETDAFHVQLLFYSSLEQTAENQLGKGVLIPRAPAKSALTVPYIYRLTPEEMDKWRLLGRLLGRTPISVSIGLRASQQRVLSEGVGR